jgi:hypothetical protein
MHGATNDSRGCRTGDSRLLSLLLFSALLFASQAAGAGGLERVDSTFDGSRFEVRWAIGSSPADLILGKDAGYDTVRLPGYEAGGIPGHPQLPARTVRIAIPDGMEVTGVRVEQARTVTLPGAFRIRPVEAPRPLSDQLAWQRVSPDAAIYTSVRPYPERRVELLAQIDLAGQNMVVLRVSPLQVVPADGQLVLLTSGTVVLEGEPGRVCGDYLPRDLSEQGRASYERRVREMVVNPQDVELRQARLRTARGVDPGQYDYVIITRGIWTELFQPLADWRTRQGRRATIVSIEWIYDGGGYVGSDIEKVRAFVEDAHANWGTTHFLLGGDDNVIPVHVRTITVPTYGTENINNDTYYADFDDDWVLEVNLGRAPVRNADIATFLDKVFTYEKSPPATDYVKTAAFFGFDITTCGDGSGENFKENYIRAQHLPPAWALETEYDSEPGSHYADVLAYLDAGSHIVNHHDHCNVDVMGTGWICHSETLTLTEAANRANGDRLSILLAVGCYPCNFPALHCCVAEAFVRNAGGGAVAFFGNTSVGWGGSVDDPDYYSLKQDRLFYRNLFDLGIYNLGENFTRAKNDEYDPYDPYNLHQFAFTQFHLLGDPGLTVWTEDPGMLAVTHPGELEAGQPTVFAVEVSDGGGPVNGATVCLWKEGDVYEVGETSGGVATFGITPGTEGTLYVTVCAHNEIPYEGEATVNPDPTGLAEGAVGARGSLELVSIRPNPFRPETEITFAVPERGDPANVSLEVYNSQGRHVRTLVDAHLPAGVHRVGWDGTDGRGIKVAAGVYFCELRCGGETRSTKMVRVR